MNRSHLSMAVAAALLTLAGNAAAAPFNSFDPRSMAMGGAGVAVGSAANAPFFNPALLSVTKDEDDFAIELPVVGGRFYGRDMITDLQDFQDANYDVAMDSAINNANLNSAQSYYDIGRATSDLDAGIASLSNRPLQGEGAAAMVIGIPSKQYGAAFVTSASVMGGGILNYNDTELADFGTAMNDFGDCASDPNPANCRDAVASVSNGLVDQNGNVNFDSSRITSSIDVRGILLAEVGVSLSREFEVAGAPVAIGVTPKFVKATTFDYTANVNTADQGEFNGDDYLNESSSFNVDVGAARDYGNGWRAGAVIKNLIPAEYDFKRLNPVTGVKDKTGSIKLQPQARVGISHSNSWSTVAADLDVTENDPVGYEDKSRYLSLGAELNAWDWAQLRAGYRANLANSDRNVASVGFGLSPFGVHWDVGFAMNADEIGAAMQLGFRF